MQSFARILVSGIVTGELKRLRWTRAFIELSSTTTILRDLINIFAIL